MKNVILLSVLAASISMQSCAQNKSSEKAPEKVMSAFQSKFPEAKKVEWDKENESEWEAEFKMNGIEYSANFNINGEWKETEHEIKKSEIPSNIISVLDQNFSDYEIEESEISESIAGKAYEFEIEIGEEEFDVVITSDGTLTKNKKNEEEDED